MPRPDSTERSGPAPGPLLPSGVRLLHSLAIDAGETSQVVWSPEGRTLAWVVNDAVVQLWDCESGAFRALRGSGGNVQGVAWAPDPRFLASVSSDTSVRVWEVATGIVQRSLRGHRGYVVSVALAPD